MSFSQIFDFTVDGECSKCGSCCGDFLPLKDDEIRTIKKFVKSHGIKEYRHNAMDGVDITCPFRDDAKQICVIYPIRPWICRQFMCNHTKEDIMKIKTDAFAGVQVISMRQTFFGNDESIKHLMELRSALIGGQ